MSSTPGPSRPERITCLEIVADDDAAELVCAALSLLVPYGWEEEGLHTGETRFRVYSENGAFCREVADEIGLRFPRTTITLATRKNVDWVEAWKDFFTPVRAGRFLVLAPWMIRERDEARAPVQPIIIEPKTAFGTGHHPTTALCLEALDSLLADGTARPGMRFLDLGTGSGILALGAALSGLVGLGLDIDMLAVENSLENRSLNQVTPQAFEVRQGSVDDAEDATCDLVLANILAAPLRNMAPRILSKLKNGGSLALSGILVSQADAVEEVYCRLGLPEPLRLLSGEWAALLWPALPAVTSWG